MTEHTNSSTDYLVNCSLNLTELQSEHPDVLQTNVLTTIVCTALSLVSCILFVGINCWNKTHNQWPSAQIQWLAYSLLGFYISICISCPWSFVASDLPEYTCVVQAILVQFFSVTIAGWFVVITVTMRHMTSQHYNVKQLEKGSKKWFLFSVLMSALILTAAPMIAHYVTGQSIFRPNSYNTWCWITVCDNPYYQLFFFEIFMLGAVIAGLVMSTIAIRKLLLIRRFSSSQFRPRIYIYVLRRSIFLVAYSIETLALIVTWIVYHLAQSDNLAYLAMNKAVVCSAGLLLIVVFKVPDRFCSLNCCFLCRKQDSHMHVININQRERAITDESFDFVAYSDAE